MQLSPLWEGRDPPFEKKNLNNLHPRMHCAKFGWKWLSGSGEEDFLTISQLSPLWVGCGPSFEQTWIPFTKECLCQIWLKLDQWIWRRRFFKVLNVFLQFTIISPWEGREPSFKHTLIPFTQGCSVPSLVEIGPVVQEKKIF